MASTKIITALLVSFLAVCVICTAEGEFSSDLASVVDRATSGPGDWDYSDGPNGPANWGKYGKSCTDGKKQSPRDVKEQDIRLDSSLDVPAKIFYEPAPAFLHGDGKTLEVVWAGGIFKLHDYDYVLEKLVFHSPSEHTYFGRRFPLEIQFYHTHPKEGVAINSLVFEEGKSNKWLEQFTEKSELFLPSLPTRESLGKRTNLGIIDSAGVEIDDLDWSRYYRYLGSLPTPPCTERPSVLWSLLKAPLSASKEQIAKIQAALLNKPNARPVGIFTNSVFYPHDV